MERPLLINQFSLSLSDPYEADLGDGKEKRARKIAKGLINLYIAIFADVFTTLIFLGLGLSCLTVFIQHVI